MSAITCILHTDEESVSSDHIDRMMDTLAEFPMDDVQVWKKDHLFLGCHAQWITPESIGEQMPFYDSERKLAITVDAIIDNREELFKLLQIESIRRNELPDSHLILLAYSKWGQDAPKYLIGDYAFILWDEKEQLLFGARDFSGGRTLYYTQQQNAFAFSTTIKPLLSLPFVPKKLNEQWIAEYLAIPGMPETVEAFLTPYLDIYQVPPAHSITIKNKKVTLTQHTFIQITKPLKLKSNKEYEEAFKEVFQKAVKARLRTNLQVSSYLSGGLDSGSIASFAARALRQEDKVLHTYSYVPIKGFQDWTNKRRVADESSLINSTAQYIGNVSPNFLDFEDKSPYNDIDEMLEIYEMPYKFFINSYWSKGCYEQASKDGAGVILSGSRGNWTISWGPPLDYQVMLLKKMKLISFYKELNQYSKNLGIARSRITPVLKRKIFKKTINKRQREPLPLINTSFASKTGVEEKIKKHGLNYQASINAYEARREIFETYSFWNINGTTNTKLSLRYKTWNRDPSNDLNVIRFCLSVPEEQYVQNGVDRSLIRRATKGYLPDDIRLNQKVRGIQGTDGISRMQNSWPTFLTEMKRLIQDPVITKYINVKTIETILSDIQNTPKSSFIYDEKYRLLMRSLIVSRFINKNF